MTKYCCKELQYVSVVSTPSKLLPQPELSGYNANLAG